MNIKIIFLLCGLSFTVYADPFDKNKREQHASKASVCHTVATTVFAQYPLSALKLIGVLQQNNVWQAFFMDDKAQIEMVTVGQFLTYEALKVKQISQFGVELSYWKNKQTCTDEGILSLKF